jgi:hypothetical protein
MPFKEVIETDEHYFLRFEPPLSQEQLSALPNPYMGRAGSIRNIDVGDVSARGWPTSAIVSTDFATEPLVALERFSLRQAALSDLTIKQRRERLEQIQNIEHLVLTEYLGKLSRADQSTAS